MKHTLKAFAGVPAGRLDVTPLPNVIFTEVLPEIDDLAEAQVTLHAFYLLYHKKGSPRYVTRDELKGDSTLQRALSKNDRPFDETLKGALEMAVERGTLLHLALDGDDWYLFNTQEGRAVIERAERGEIKADKTFRRPAPAPVEPPNIFGLYEQNIGALTPLVAEELKEAEKEYPPNVITDAFRIAAENNVRKWAYVRSILEGWTREGKYEASRRNIGKRREPHFQGEFIDRIKRKRK